MARPLRIEFPGAIYHSTSRGDRREPIFVDDADRESLLAVLATGMARFDAQVLAYCLMGNDHHFVLHTRQVNLSALMRHVNGLYTQAFDRRHAKLGHLLQGRFKAILVDRDAYLREVCRYEDLNPVRAGMVDEPAPWPWSSYRAHVGRMPPPEWLDSASPHAYLLGHPACSVADERRATKRYVALVAAGRDVRLWDEALRQQIYLGDEAFVERMQALAVPKQEASRDVPRPQRSKPLTLSQWLGSSESREEPFLCAHTQSGISMTAIAREMGLSVSYVSRLIGRAEAALQARSSAESQQTPEAAARNC